MGISVHSTPKVLVRLDTNVVFAEAWVAIRVPVHPKGVHWGYGQNKIQASYCNSKAFYTIPCFHFCINSFVKNHIRVK